MNQTRSGKFVLAGALAGLSLILAVMLVFALVLFSVALWQYAFNSQIPIIQDTAWLAVLQDFNRLPGFLWEWRWIVVVLTIGGTLLGLLDRFVQRYSVVWRNRIAAATVFVVIGTITLAVFLINAEQSLLSGSGQAESLATLAQRRSSAWGLVFLGAVPTIGAAGALWLGWSWWYAHWRQWLRLNPIVAEQPEPAQPSADQWFAARQDHHQARRLIALLLVGSVLVLVAAVNSYEQVRNTVQSGDLWVEPTAPSSSAQLNIDHSIRRIMLENTYGTGTASVILLSLPNGAPVSEPVTLTFRDLRVSYDRTTLEIRDVPIGKYQLKAQLDSGPGGRLSYALVQSGGWLAFALTILVGISASAALALVMLLFSTLVSSRS